MEQENASGAAGNPPAKKNIFKIVLVVVLAGLGVVGGVAAGVKLGIIPASWVAACFPCRPRNPCAANPYAAANPCAAENPCATANPCNPCATVNPCAATNPCAAENPCAAQ